MSFTYLVLPFDICLQFSVSKCDPNLEVNFVVGAVFAFYGDQRVGEVAEISLYLAYTLKIGIQIALCHKKQTSTEVTMKTNEGESITFRVSYERLGVGELRMRVNGLSKCRETRFSGFKVRKVVKDRLCRVFFD
jgi:hypothetical protein